MTSQSVYDSIVCYGDSLTARGAAAGGHVASMTEAYLRRLDVVNRGHSGYTTREAVAMAGTFFVPISEGAANSPAQIWGAVGREIPGPSRVRPPAVRLAIVWFGANDAALPGQQQHTPIEEYEANLRSIISTIEQAHSLSPSLSHVPPPRILLLTPPPVYPTPFLAGSRTLGVTRKYADAVLRVRSSSGDNVAAIDIFEAFQVREKRRLAKGGKGQYEGLLDADGLHLGKDGYKLVFQEIMAFIRDEWPDLAPEAIPMLFPPYSELRRDRDRRQLEAQLFAKLEAGTG